MPTKTATSEVQKEAGSTGASINGRVIHADYDTRFIKPEVAFVTYGAPASQGSKKHVGRGKLVESDQGLHPWRDAVREQAKQTILHKGEEWSGPISDPVFIQVVFTFSHSKESKKRGDIYHKRTPDLDKLQRAIGDALSPTPVPLSVGKGLAPTKKAKLRAEAAAKAKEFCILDNDSCIVGWDAKKVYAGMTTDALHYPGVSVEVWRMRDLHEAYINRPRVELRGTQGEKA